MKMVLPSFTQLVLILVFTIVEVIFLTLWLIIANGGFMGAAVIVLTLGLLLEHYIATVSGNVGPSTNNNPFDKPSVTSTTTFTQAYPQSQWIASANYNGPDYEPQ